MHAQILDTRLVSGLDLSSCRVQLKRAQVIVGVGWDKAVAYIDLVLVHCRDAGGLGTEQDSFGGISRRTGVNAKAVISSVTQEVCIVGTHFKFLFGARLAVDHIVQYVCL